VAEHPINDPKHWRKRAEEARIHAEQLTDPEARRMMLEIAEDYETLAKRAEQRLRNSK
jgi:DNA-binding ferritin-like protein